MPITDHQEAEIRRLKPQCGLDDATYRFLLREDFDVHSARELTPGGAETFILALRVLQLARQDVQELPSGTKIRWKCLFCGSLLREAVLSRDEVEFYFGDPPQHCGCPVHPHFLLEHEWNSEK